MANLRIVATYSSIVIPGFEDFLRTLSLLCRARGRRLTAMVAMHGSPVRRSHSEASSTPGVDCFRTLGLLFFFRGFAVAPQSLSAQREAQCECNYNPGGARRHDDVPELIHLALLWQRLFEPDARTVRSILIDEDDASGQIQAPSECPCPENNELGLVLDGFTRCDDCYMCKHV